MTMERMPDFEWSRPASYAEAAAQLAAEPGARLLAGGTDLVPNLRRGLAHPTRLLDLGAVPGQDEMQIGEGDWVLGAGVTLAQLAQMATDPRLQGAGAALAEAARAAAGPGHRTAATVAGNLCQDTRCVFYNQSEWWRQANAYCLKRGGTTCHVAPQGERCHAAFSGDLAPALMVLGASVELLSNRGQRRLALADCYRDDGAAHLTLEHDEVLTRIVVPAPATGLVSGYRKARVRGAMDFPLAGVACALRMDGAVLAELCLALTGTNSHPLLLQGTAGLLGKPLDDAALTALGKLVQKQVSPMRTTVTSSNYRRQAATVLARRLVLELARTAAQPGGAA
jgi:4-hydroxybenzoyl-CoA reductase subunit beta